VLLYNIWKGISHFNLYYLYSSISKYKAVKEEMKEMTEAKRNIDMFLEADRATDRQEKKRQKSQNADL